VWLAYPAQSTGLLLLINNRIVSEADSSGRFRRSLLAVPVNQTSVTLEFGNPPAMNITMTPPPSIEEEIEMARESNDSVDLQVKIGALTDYNTVKLIVVNLDHFLVGRRMRSLRVPSMGATRLMKTLRRQWMILQMVSTPVPLAS
jgi:hypothetical protein